MSGKPYMRADDVRARKRTVWIGFDPRETAAFYVARRSIKRHRTAPIPVYGLVLRTLMAQGLYTRPMDRRLGKWIDKLSVREDYNGELSTEFALSRFLVKHLAETGLALFMDCDQMLREDIKEAFRECERNPGKAVYCVKHNHVPQYAEKMDGCAQTVYPRKNWSSFYIIDCDHPKNAALTIEAINSKPGLWLHQFSHLDDADIGELDPAWNWLEGESDPRIDPLNVHWTKGGPWFENFKNVAYADEWREIQDRDAEMG